MTDDSNDTGEDRHGYTTEERAKASEFYWLQVGARFKARGSVDLLCSRLLDPQALASITSLWRVNSAVALRELTKLELEVTSWFADTTIRGIERDRPNLAHRPGFAEDMIRSMLTSKVRISGALDQRLAEATEALNKAVTLTDREQIDPVMTTVFDFLREFTATSEMLASVSTGHGLPSRGRGADVSVTVQEVDFSDPASIAKLPESLQKALKAVTEVVHEESGE